MMPKREPPGQAPYPAAVVDARFDALRQGVRADIAEVRTEIAGVRTEIREVEGRLGAKIEGLRGEMKVWFLVATVVLAPVASLALQRYAAVVWPLGQVQPGR